MTRRPEIGQRDRSNALSQLEARHHLPTGGLAAIRAKNQAETYRRRLAEATQHDNPPSERNQP